MAVSKSRSLVAWSAPALVALALVPLTAHAAGHGRGGDARTGVYVVQMIDDPVADYAGGVPGYAATRPAEGTRLRASHPDAVRYGEYLAARHDDALREVGGLKVHDYRIVYNGFSAELTPAQAEALKQKPGVLAVAPDELRWADTSSTPQFLGLDARGGLWSQWGGQRCAGAGVVIGIIDTGIWPENPSFARPHGHGFDDCPVEYEDRHEFEGTCATGEAFTRHDCNGKIVGARWFNAAFGGDAGLKAQRPWEFASPRDLNGHGSHTASTAGGNAGVQPTGPASIFGMISGVAPAARIAVYKALWAGADGTANGYTSDLVAAIDQAVADGVDVINYSISGTRTNFLDPVSVSFLYAARAGVFVAASAGNSGPDAYTVAHPGIWITTVAAGTHDRTPAGTATTGDGATYAGVSTAASQAGPAPLVGGSAARAAGARATAARRCYSTATNGGAPALDPARVAGNIVVCERGDNARVDKSLAVAEAGGVGMILVNTSEAQGLNADFHSVPTVHLPSSAHAALDAYADGAGATASVSKATLRYDAPAPITASFSSRGPSLAASGNILKPDLMAPGQDVLAAVAPPGNGGRSFDVYSGTSMSSPHVAGLAALLRGLHPRWSPMAIKSALMTTGGDVLDGASTDPAVIFSQGAGHVRPNLAADPGLVYDSGYYDWLAFLCGTTGGVSASTCAALAAAGWSLDPSDANVPSIAASALAGKQTFTRRVTNVGKRTATFRSSVVGLAGFDVAVSPATLRLGPGETRPFRVTVTRTTAPFDAPQGGYLVWKDAARTVRSPVVVVPVSLRAPPEVAGTGGAISYPIAFGYDGAFAAEARGLLPAATSSGTVAQDPTGSFAPGGPGTTSFTVTVPAGTTYARFSLFDANVTQGSDLDLYVLDSAGDLVGASGGPTAAEEVDLVDPPPDTYTVWVHGYGVPGGAADLTLFAWTLGATPAGNMSVAAPAAAALGEAGTVSLSFAGLAPGTRYLGAVAYAGTSGTPPTIVRVDTP